MGNLPGWVIPVIILVIVILAILIIVGVVSSRRRRARQEEIDRQRAAELRNQAQKDQVAVKEREIKARETELEADKAKVEAERREQAAQEQRQDADQARADVDDRLRQADELDPDVSTKKTGARSDAEAPVEPTAADETGAATSQPEDSGASSHGAGVAAGAAGAGAAGAGATGAAASHGDRTDQTAPRNREAEAQPAVHDEAASQPTTGGESAGQPGRHSEGQVQPGAHAEDTAHPGSAPLGERVSDDATGTAGTSDGTRPQGRHEEDGHGSHRAPADDRSAAEDRAPAGGGHTAADGAGVAAGTAAGAGVAAGAHSHDARASQDAQDLKSSEADRGTVGERRGHDEQHPTGVDDTAARREGAPSGVHRGPRPAEQAEGQHREDRRETNGTAHRAQPVEGGSNVPSAEASRDSGRKPGDADGHVLSDEEIDARAAASGPRTDEQRTAPRAGGASEDPHGAPTPVESPRAEQSDAGARSDRAGTEVRADRTDADRQEARVPREDSSIDQSGAWTRQDGAAGAAASGTDAVDDAAVGSGTGTGGGVGNGTGTATTGTVGTGQPDPAVRADGDVGNTQQPRGRSADDAQDGWHRVDDVSGSDGPRRDPQADLDTGTDRGAYEPAPRSEDDASTRAPRRDGDGDAGAPRAGAEVRAPRLEDDAAESTSRPFDESDPFSVSESHVRRARRPREGELDDGIANPDAENLGSEGTERGQ